MTELPALQKKLLRYFEDRVHLQLCDEKVVQLWKTAFSLYSCDTHTLFCVCISWNYQGTCFPNARLFLFLCFLRARVQRRAASRAVGPAKARLG